MRQENFPSPIRRRRPAKYHPRINRQKTKTPNRNKNEEKIRPQTTKALNTIEINSFLYKAENYLGVFSSDQLDRVKIVSFPCFLVINTAPNKQKFGHWLSIRIDKKSVEIFDSLGLDTKKWGSFPRPLINFLYAFSQHKTIFVSPVLQPRLSQLCGFYSIFFVLARNVLSFSDILDLFTVDLASNDILLLDLLQTVL